MQFEKRLYTVDHVLHSVQNVQLYYRSIYLRTNKELMTFCSKKKTRKQRKTNFNNFTSTKRLPPIINVPKKNREDIFLKWT